MLYAKHNNRRGAGIKRNTYTRATKQKENVLTRVLLGVLDRRNSMRKEDRNFFNLLFDFKFNHDRRVFFAFLCLLMIGIVVVFSSSVVFADKFMQNKYYYLTHHLTAMVVGFAGLLFFYFIRPHIFVRFWFFFLFLSISFLLYLFILGLLGRADVVDGANRWLDIGGFQFQPSDVAKLSFVIFLAAFLSNRKTHYANFKEYCTENLLPYSVWFGTILLLVILGKNLGTSMVIGFIGLTCYGASITSKYHKIGFLIMLGVMASGGIALGVFEGYRADRIAVWSNYVKTGDTIMYDDTLGTYTREGKSYQFDQVLTALGTGGVLGIGAGESTSKYYFVKTTAGDDSIWGIIGEEWGFIATTGILLLYLYMLLTCISIARDLADKPIYYFLIVGCSAWIGFQTFVHVGANTGILPLTGQTLPFISLGGSSLVSLMSAMGLILNVTKQRAASNEDISEITTQKTKSRIPQRRGAVGYF